MPCRPFSTSLVAASCGSLLSRNFAANPSNPGSNVMVTDSVAFCASAEKLGIASLGLGAARASAGVSSAKSQSDMHCLIQLFLGAASSAGLCVCQRCGLALHRFVCKVQFLARHPQRLQDLAPRLESALLQPLLLQVLMHADRKNH